MEPRQIEDLVEELIRRIQGFRIVKEQESTVIQLSSTSNPIGSKTVTKYYIEPK